MIHEVHERAPRCFRMAWIETALDGIDGSFNRVNGTRRNDLSKSIALGKTAKDVVTDFAGIITGKCSYLTGCTQYLLTPKMRESGEFQDGRWFDEQRLTVLDDPKVEFDNEETPGFDVPAPI